MHRIATLALAVACLLAFTALTAQAAAKKKAADAGTVVGTIKEVSEDGKKLTVTLTGKKKKKNATAQAAGKKKKKKGADREITINDKTKIEYVGIDDKAEQKLTVGYAVTVTLDEENKDLAKTIKVSKEPAKKKKKKNDQ
jgi:hypothetical protein